MPSPQHVKGVSSTRPLRRFTVVQANATLPLVRRVVRDVVRTHQAIEQLQAQVAQEKSPPALQRQLDLNLEHLQDYVDELQEIGCELKDVQRGLIDFVGRHQGRDVCLCWQLDEPHIEYWHDLHSGVNGRQPIDTLDEAEA